MTTHQYLSKIILIDKIIENKKLQREKLLGKAISLSAPNNSDRVISSKSMDKMGDAVADMVDKDPYISNSIIELENKQNKIIQQIESVEDIVLYDLLFKIYVLNYSFNNFAEYKGCTTRNVANLHKKALETFEKMYGNEYIS